MANATVTQSNGVCYIQTPPTLHSMHLIPKASGNAAWVNQCNWTDESSGQPVILGAWSAQMKTLKITSNPFDLINNKTFHGIISTQTDPTVTGLTKTALQFTHQVNSSSPVVPDDLKITVTNITDDITFIMILAEDGGDKNYLDFNMSIIVVDKA